VIKPLNNNCLIEEIDEYDGIIRDTHTENVQKGMLRAYGLVLDHLTASTGYKIEDVSNYRNALELMLDKLVYWQEYADAGNKFTIEDKKYVLVPFYRIIGVEE
jgi:co-chaperonin GroES (HSP10)